MSSDDLDLPRLERLASLELDPAQRERFGAELRRLLGYVDQLQEIDESLLGEAAFESRQAVRLREDEAEPGLGTERALGSAPSRHDDFFDVPGALGAEA